MVWFMFFLQILIFLCSCFVVCSRGPIYSILFFILVVLNLSIFLILLSADFLAFSFLIVYIGAICILFLFIVFMLNVRFLELGGSVLNYFSICGLIIFIFIGEFFNIIVCSSLTGTNISLFLFDWTSWLGVINNFTNIFVLGEVLYSYYFIFFLVVGFVLLLAMVVSIVLTLEYRLLIASPLINQQIIRVTTIKVLTDNNTPFQTTNIKSRNIRFF